MSKTAVIAAPPNMLGVPRVDFYPEDFNSLLYTKGYQIVIEPSFPCPCKYREVAAQSICMNCMGSGLVFGSQTKCRGAILSINKSTKYKEWSAEMVGTASLSIESRFQLGLYDKITVTDSSSIFAENLLVKKVRGKYFLQTGYNILSVDMMFRYVSENEPLQRIVEGEDFIIEGGRVVFTDNAINTIDEKRKISQGDSISLRYRHEIQYLVIDIPHDLRNTYVLDYQSSDNQEMLPVQATIRKLHYVIDGLNLEKNNLIYNPTAY